MLMSKTCVLSIFGEKLAQIYDFLMNNCGSNQ